MCGVLPRRPPAPGQKETPVARGQKRGERSNSPSLSGPGYISSVPEAARRRPAGRQHGGDALSPADPRKKVIPFCCRFADTCAHLLRGEVPDPVSARGVKRNGHPILMRSVRPWPHWPGSDAIQSARPRGRNPPGQMPNVPDPAGKESQSSNLPGRALGTVSHGQPHCGPLPHLSGQAQPPDPGDHGLDASHASHYLISACQPGVPVRSVSVTDVRGSPPVANASTQITRTESEASPATPPYGPDTGPMYPAGKAPATSPGAAHIPPRSEATDGEDQIHNPP